MPKLVRDLVPNRLKALGLNPVYEEAQHYQRFDAYLDKFEQVSQESQLALKRGDIAAITQTVASLLELIFILLKHYNIAWDTIRKARKMRRQTHGSYKQCYLLHTSNKFLG